MNKHLLFIPVLLVASQICLAQTPVSATPEPQSKVWGEFSLPNGQFVVSMPGTPQSLAVPLEPKTLGLVAHVLALDKENESYAVTYVEFPNPVDEAPKSKAMLDVIAEKELTKVAGKLMAQTEIAIDGHPGRELHIEVADGFWVDRIYLVGRRMYVVSAFAAKIESDAKQISQQQEAVIRKYFETFKLKPQQ